jgi:hypothetical protein
MNGYQIEKLRIIAILRDWRKADAKHKQGYPQKPVATIDIPVWPLEETYQYIRDRISIHQAAEAGTIIGCSNEERWYTGTTWALKKVGGKRAIKIFERKEDIGTELTDGTFIEERPGIYRRCSEYCEVSNFCEQYEPDREEVSASVWESDCSS